MATMQMDPELAKSLFFEGATVVILNMPKGTEFGIDYNSWEVGPKFRGVKMIPPGIHFLHYSSVDKANPRNVGPRMGFFLSLQQRGLTVLRWNSAQEEVDLSPAPEAEVEAMRANLQELDQFLGPYPYPTLKKWISLTNFISEATMERLQPESRQICAFSEVLPVLSLKHTKDRMEQNLPRCGTECKSYQEGLARLPEMKPKAGTEIRFSQLPTQMFPAGATPAEITRHSMDLSYALETMLSKQFPSSPKDVLGEEDQGSLGVAKGGCWITGYIWGYLGKWFLNLAKRQSYPVPSLKLQMSGPSPWRLIQRICRGAPAVCLSVHVCSKQEPQANLMCTVLCLGTTDMAQPLILQVEAHRGKGFDCLRGQSALRAQGSWFPGLSLPSSMCSGLFRGGGLSAGLDQDSDFLKTYYSFYFAHLL